MKIKDINAICDVAYFKWQPTNIGCVFQPNNVYIKMKNDIILLKIFNKF